MFSPYFYLNNSTVILSLYNSWHGSCIMYIGVLDTNEPMILYQDNVTGLF